MDREELKKTVAEFAVANYVKSGMKLGLGTGSTAKYVIRAVAQRIKDGLLKDILAVSTSFQTTLDCQELGIPLSDLNHPAINGQLDLAIDGADEVDQNNRLTKGGGAAMLLEKITAYSASLFVVVVDEAKLVKNLGVTFPVPIEVLPAARVPVYKALVALKGQPQLRMGVKKAGPVVTDCGNLIYDCVFPPITDPVAFEGELARIPGIVESGIFAAGKYKIIVAKEDGTVTQRG